MKLILFTFCTICNVYFSQENIYSIFTSEKGYSIEIPKSFEKSTNSNKFDLKFTDDYGASILVLINDRNSDELKITPHDIDTKELEKALKSVFPNYKISWYEKINISNKKAILIESIGSYSSTLKSLVCEIYVNEKVYSITCSASITSYQDYKTLFLKVIKSIKFKS